MAVHLPLSIEAQVEAHHSDDVDATTSSARPTAQPIISPSQDIVMGCYYLTLGRARCVPATACRVRHPRAEVHMAFQQGKVQSACDPIRAANAQGSPRTKREGADERTRPRRAAIIQTTVGRVLFNDMLSRRQMAVLQPEPMKSSRMLSNVISDCYEFELGRREDNCTLLDRHEGQLGFRDVDPRAACPSVTERSASRPDNKDKVIGEAEKDRPQEDRSCT